jgi:DNA-binding MarR family transcriptional regulator
VETAQTCDNLLRLAAWVDDRLRRALGMEGLTISHFEVLEFLAGHPGTEVSELLLRTGYQKSTLCRMLSALKRRKLISLRRSHGPDSRRRAAVVSTAGSELVRHVQSDLALAVSELLEGVPVRTKTGFVQSIEKITRAAEAPRFEVPLAGLGRLWRYPRLSSPREAATEAS